MKTILTLAAAAAAFTALATPAAAVVTTFASYNPIGSTANLYWKNNGTGSVATNGTGGSFYTIATSSATTPGSRNVRFSFLQAGISPFVTDVVAGFSLFATVVAHPATLSGTQLSQDFIYGTFSFVSTTPITVGATTYAAGSNLLSAVFTLGTINGRTAGTSGSFSGSTTGGSVITYTSDFLNFTPTIDRDFAIGLTSITSSLSRATGKALRTFKANSTGSFSSDPAPLINAVPEPATWAMLVAGFGMVGVAARRRKSVVAA